MTDSLPQIRRAKLRRLRETAADAYPNDFRRSHLFADLRAACEGKDRAALEAAPLRAACAGRLMLHRRMGKAAFFTLQDMSGQMQVYAGNKTLGEELFAATDDWDLGDIVGCEGVMFKTNKGELTLRADKMRLLVKALRPPPEKYHGLADDETRYRHRHLSLLSSAAEREIFARRAAAVRYIRDFFHKRGYLEMETPILQPIPGGARAQPFVTHCNALSADFYLRIAQELYLKRLIVGGFERVFELNRNFRNEGVSPRHNPEFTMLEFNAAYQTCEDFILLTEELLHGLVVELTGGETITYQEQEISFARPFARLSPLQALCAARADISQQQFSDNNFLAAELAKLPGEKIQNAAALTTAQMQLLLFEKTAEHTLIQPTFLVDYPAESSPLAKRRPDNAQLAERFEMFVAGRELVNGFSEQNDPELQAEIFRQQAAEKEAGDKEAMHYDADYIHALECGLPPNAGGGIGIDRLIMLLTDRPAIRDVVLFPQLRSVDS